MAITLDVTLPEQPPTGSGIEYIPLGGNGFNAPKSAFYGNLQVTGDVSGGIVTMSVFRDPRFEHVVSFLACEKLQTDTAGFRMSIGRRAMSVHNEGSTIASAVTGDSFTGSIYAPVAMLDASVWQLRMENADGIVMRFKFLVFNFNIEASLRTPLPILLASLPRAPTLV